MRVIRYYTEALSEPDPDDPELLEALEDNGLPADPMIVLDVEFVGSPEPGIREAEVWVKED